MSRIIGDRTRPARRLLEPAGDGNPTDFAVGRKVRHRLRADRRPEGGTCAKQARQTRTKAADHPVRLMVRHPGPAPLPRKTRTFARKAKIYHLHETSGKARKPRLGQSWPAEICALPYATPAAFRIKIARSERRLFCGRAFLLLLCFAASVSPALLRRKPIPAWRNATARTP